MDLRHDVEAAYERIRGSIRRTPLESSPWLAADDDMRVDLKLENLQRTGSFKLRGALSKLTALSAQEREAGVVAASTGNHGAGVADAAAQVGTRALVYVPTTADEAKLAAVRALGAELRFEGADCIEAENAARAFATSTGATYVSPYNDPLVVAGQGTVGLELAEDASDVDAVFVAVGGGGLISGVGGYLRALGRNVEIVGCSPRNSAVLCASLEAGRVLDLPSEPTLSDGTAGGMEHDSITFALCRDTIDRFELVDEDEIRAAMCGVIEHHHTLIEGAAGVAVAAFQRSRERYAGKRVAIVLCGANVSRATLRSIL